MQASKKVFPSPLVHVQSWLENFVSEENRRKQKQQERRKASLG
jgi:hypothetical protein